MNTNCQRNITNRQSNTQIAKSFTSNLISSLSGKMFTFGLGLMLLDQTRSALSFGINMLIAPITGLIFLIPIGNLVDTHRHRSILIGSMLVRIVALIIFASTINLFLASMKLLPIVLFLIVDAVSTNLNDTCFSAAIHELVNQDKVQRLSSLTQTAISIAAILSPTLGVGLYSLVGFTGFIWLEIVTTILSFLIMLSMHFYEGVPVAPNSHRQTLGSQWATFKAGLIYMQSRSVIKITIMMGLVLNFFYTAVTIGVPYILKDELHTGNAMLGIFETGGAVGMLLGSLIMSCLPALDRRHFFWHLMVPLIILTGLIAGLGSILVLHLTPIQLMVSGSLVMGSIAFMLVWLNIIVQVYLQKTVPTRNLGRVLATLTTVNTSIMPVGTMFFTMIFQYSSTGGIIFLINGGLLLSYTIILIRPFWRAVQADKY